MMLKFFAALAASLATTLAAAQSKWDMPTAYPAASFHTENAQQFATEVDKASGGKLKITLHPNGASFKANEIKKAVESGQAQAGEILLSGAAGENPIFGLDSVPFLATSYKDARRLADLQKPRLEAVLATSGLKLLYTVPWPGQSLFSVKPVESVADLKGTHMRAYNPATTRIAQVVGAEPVSIQAAELSQALATGKVDNLLTSSATGVENKLYEGVKYFYSVNAWLPKNAVVVSAKAFEALDKPTQAAVLKAAAAAEQRGWKASETKNAEYLKELSGKGMTVAEPTELLRRELKVVGGRMTTEWLKTAGEDSQAIVAAYTKQ